MDGVLKWIKEVGWEGVDWTDLAQDGAGGGLT
jgi:hypothetical protein